MMLFFRAIANNNTLLLNQRLLGRNLSAKFFSHGSHFHFYSFEEEIHKLKVAQDAAINNQVDKEVNKNMNDSVQRKIQELNKIYREGKMLNFRLDPNYQSIISTQIERKKKDQQNSEILHQIEITSNFNSEQKKEQQPSQLQNDQLFIRVPLKLVEETLQSESSRKEKGLVLENFLHNILLAMLCDSTQIYKEIQSNQERGPLLDEMKLLKIFLQKLIVQEDIIEIARENISIFKFLVKTFELLKINSSKAFPFIQKYVNDVVVQDSRLSSLHEISLLLLPISDYFQEIGLKEKNNNTKIDLSPLSAKISSILKEKNAPNQKRSGREHVSTLCKTLFCMVRINSGKSKVCLDLSEKLLGSNYESLTEIEMTSILYSLSKLQYEKEKEVSFERKIKREMPNLIYDYETKVEKMLSTRYFHYARVPYILYCLQNSSKYRPPHRKNQVNHLCSSLFAIAIRNYEKYKATEITTIIYSLKLINPEFQAEIEQLYRSYFLKLALDQQKKDRQYQLKQQQQKQEEKRKMEIIDDLKDEEDQKFLIDHMDNQFHGEYNHELLVDTSLPSNKKTLSVNPKVPPHSSQEINKRNEKPQPISSQNLKNQPFKNDNLNIKNQKDRNIIVYFEQLQAVDILCLFIGIRNNEKNQHSSRNSQDDKVNSIFVINQQLFQLFLSKQDQITTNLKIKILYEVAYNHSRLVDSYIFEKYFSEWIQLIQEKMVSLNNYDFIALGFIMKKFARLFSYHIDFWIKFNDELNLRQFIHPVEAARIRIVVQNMHDFFFKCINSPPTVNKQEKNRIKKLQLVFNKFCDTQNKLNLIKISSNKVINNENSQLDFDSSL